jgi:two-component system, OmpR family, KDP operon response regulator KdpE
MVMDGDPGIGRMLRVFLGSERYRVRWCRGGAEGLAEGVRWRPEVFILELELPDADGFAVLRSLREWSEAPVLILSGRTGTADKVRALDAGANDYLEKPFAPEELAARLRVLLRDELPTDDGPVLVSGALRIDMATREVTVNGSPLGLSATEEAVLHILARHAGRIVPWRRLVRAIWGTDAAPKIHDLQVHISRLRRKLETRGATDLIRGRIAVGYTLFLAPVGEFAVPDPALP